MIRVGRIGTNYVTLEGDGLKPEEQTSQASHLSIHDNGFAIRINVPGLGIDCEEGLTREQVIPKLEHMVEDARLDLKVDEDSINEAIKYLVGFARKNHEHFRKLVPSL